MSEFMMDVPFLDIPVSVDLLEHLVDVDSEGLGASCCASCRRLSFLSWPF